MRFSECESCGKIPEMTLINGYNFGDRLLEGVMFEIVLDKGKPKCLGVAAEYENYFSNLNQKKWMKEAEREAMETDMDCPICGSEIYLENDKD